MTRLTSSVRYDSLKNSVAVVTGGASGIGRGIVAALAAQGVRVAFLDRDEAGAAETIAASAPGQVRFLRCDLTDTDSMCASIVQIASDLGPIRILVNNAGNDDQHRTADITPAYFDDRIATNLRHYVFAIQSVAPGMAAAGGGSIVNLGSIAWKMADGSAPLYVTCKAAISGLTRALAREFGPVGVRVNTVLPGWVMTERQRKLWVDAAAEAQIDASQCLPGRLAGDDIAAMVLWLASDQARMCTAQDFIVDGGWV
jgi:NAD(P)-dependent dehydrogenase (short-subunit alcohol dehydrogenase family)